MIHNSLPPVLYVEDDENDVLLMKLAFARAGVTHPLDIAADGKQALQYLFNISEPSRAAGAIPCLILLDLNLPRVSGLEVLQRVRQMPQFKDLPIVIFSSSAQASDQERATELGATAYIVKPTTIDQIVAVARELDRRWLATCTAKT